MKHASYVLCWLLLLLWSTDASAQSRYSLSESLRPIVTPALVWRFDAGATVTTREVGEALVTLPRLTATVGVPGVGIPWRGLELSTTLVDFVVAPAFRYAPQVALRQMLLPSPTRAVVAESRDPVELAVGLRVGSDPLMGSHFRIDGSFQVLLRAPSVLRVDLTPTIGYQFDGERAVVELPVRAVIQPLPGFYVAAVSGVVVPDLRSFELTTIPVGGQVGLTLPSDFGSQVDLVLDAMLPYLFVPGSSEDPVRSESFRVMATLRIYTYWDLNATDPDRGGVNAERCKRCGCEP